MITLWSPCAAAAWVILHVCSLNFKMVSNSAFRYLEHLNPGPWYCDSSTSTRILSAGSARARMRVWSCPDRCCFLSYNTMNLSIESSYSSRTCLFLIQLCFVIELALYSLSSLVDLKACQLLQIYSYSVQQLKIRSVRGSESALALVRLEQKSSCKACVQQRQHASW